jgi:hypothetical protein
VLFAYYGARLIAQLLGTSESPEESDVSLSTIWRDATRAADSAKLSVLDRILDEYVGDVFSYVNSAGNAFYRENNEPSVPDAVVNVYPQIMQRFYDQLLKAQADGCTEMQVVAHSLGAVIAYHALSGLSADPERRMDTEAIRSASGNVRRLYTIGSPLEKIRFFWPRLVARPLAVGALTLQWDNFVSWFDPVAGTLKRLTTWGDVVNHRLLGGGFLRGHVVYERSPVFLGALTRGLCGREIPLVRTFKERWWDRLILIGETLLAPTAVAVVLICGMALFLLTALLLPFLISLILRQFLVESTWVSIENTSSLILIASMVIAFVLGPLIRASKVHRLYWVGSAGKP